MSDLKGYRLLMAIIVLELAIIGVLLFLEDCEPTSNTPSTGNNVKTPEISVSQDDNIAEIPTNNVKDEEEQEYTEYQMIVTAYTLDPSCTGKDTDHPAYGITASGKKIGEDIFEEDGIIASPKDFEFGTVMEVEGWGTGTVWDRGGAIVWNEERQMYHLDIFINDMEKALEWGRKVVTVKVFKED